MKVNARTVITLAICIVAGALLGAFIEQQLSLPWWVSEAGLFIGVFLGVFLAARGSANKGS